MNEAEVTTEELRELIRQGHTMIKDLNQTMKEVRQVIGVANTLVMEAKNAPKVEVVKEFQEALEQGTKDLTEYLVEQTDAATAFVTEEIYKRFDLMMSTILGIDEANGKSIPRMIREKYKPKIDLDALSVFDHPLERPKS